LGGNARRMGGFWQQLGRLAMQVFQHLRKENVVSTINPGVASRRSGSSTLKQFRADNHISERTWKRLKAAGDIPRITWITKCKGIVRDEHGRATASIEEDAPDEAVQ